MARLLPSAPPRSRHHAQAARANDPLDENRLDADHRRATDGLRGRRHPRQLEHSRARVLVESGDAVSFCFSFLFLSICSDEMVRLARGLGLG